MGNRKKKIARIDITGKNLALFRFKRQNFLNKIMEMIEPIDEEEVIEQSALSFDFLEEKIKSNNIEDYKTMAEIEEKFSQSEKNKAEAESIRAKTKRDNFTHNLRQAKMLLTVKKIILRGESGHESITFIKDIDAYLELIDNLLVEQRQTK